MIFVALILFFILLFICLLLFSPLIIEADTRVPELTIEWKRLATVHIGYTEEEIYIHIRALFFERRWRPGPSPGKTKQKMRAGRSGVHARKKGRKIFLKSLRLLKTFRVTRMDIVLDTSDPVLNAYMFPVNFFTYPAGRSIRINFLGENYMALRVRNIPWRLLKAWLGVGI